MILDSVLDYIERGAMAPFENQVAVKVAAARQARKDFDTARKYRAFKAVSSGEGESSDADFIDIEEAMAALFQMAWSRKAQTVYDQMIDAMDGTFNGTITQKAEWTQAGMQDAVVLGTAKMADLLTQDDWDRLKYLTKLAAKRGAAVADGVTALERVPRFEKVMEGMTNASRYYTNNYFNTQVVPTLYKAIERVMGDGDLTSPERIFRSVREALDKRLLGRTPYWHTVSSGAASRAYHYGLIKAGRAKGYLGYKLRVILDDRTSDICRALSGKEFWLADAERIYDKVAEAQGDDIKSIHPWLTKADVEGLSASEVYSKATLVPPFHGRCRTTMELLSI